VDPTPQELLDRALAFETECKERYDRHTDPAKKRYDVLGMSDALMEQVLLEIEHGEELRHRMILTAQTGTNADLIPTIFALYIPEGSTVADVTFGKGVFWQNIDQSKYKALLTDLQTGVDFRSLPYDAASLDALIIDPPYMNGGKKKRKTLTDCYKTDDIEGTGHANIIRLYAGGLLEAARVLKKKGVIVVKCQDAIAWRIQRWSHIDLIQLLGLFGFEVVDLFILVQKSVPMLRHPAQQHARKNHSYAIVARFKE
jgi:hypothetical protein